MVADLDGDGDQDLLAFGQPTSGEVVCKVYRNADGKGLSWQELAALARAGPGDLV